MILSVRRIRMTKPREYKEQRVVRCDTHYEVQEGVTKGPFAGSGVLTTGRVVWISSTAPQGELSNVFADGIGVVSIDSHSL